MLNPTSVVALSALGMVKEGGRMENGGREAGGGVWGKRTRLQNRVINGIVFQVISL